MVEDQQQEVNEIQQGENQQQLAVDESQQLPGESQQLPTVEEVVQLPPTAEQNQHEATGEECQQAAEGESQPGPSRSKKHKVTKSDKAQKDISIIIEKIKQQEEMKTTIIELEYKELDCERKHLHWQLCLFCSGSPDCYYSLVAMYFLLEIFTLVA